MPRRARIPAALRRTMLLDAGASLTIVGHSERREAQRESDAEVKAKAEAALACGLNVILCVGESLDVREAGEAVETVVAQLDASLPRRLDATAELAIAYEPIWAIGTGKIPTARRDRRNARGAPRGGWSTAYGEPGSRVRILYGGSVKASNAAEIFAVADVDGALVGGASLKAADFMPIVAAAAAALKAGPRSPRVAADPFPRKPVMFAFLLIVQIARRRLAHRRRS